jgi:hypothetical protein
MSIFGVALRGFGKALLKHSKNTAKKKFDAKRSTFKAASEKNKLNQDVSKTVKDFKSASERAVRLTGKIGLKKD